LPGSPVLCAVFGVSNASVLLRQELPDICREFCVVLVQKAVGGVGIDLEPRTGDQSGEQVGILGKDHRVAITVRDKHGEGDRRHSLQQGVVGDAPRAHRVVLREACVPGSRGVRVRARPD